MDIFALFSISVKFTLYVGVFFSAGTVFYIVLFEKSEARPAFSPQKFIHRFITLAMLSTLAVYALRAASLTGEWSGMVDPEIWGLLWQTPIQTAFVLRIIGVILIALGACISSIGKPFSVTGSIIMLASFGQVGHIITLSDLNIIATILLLIHLIGISLWAGILFPLYRLTTHPNLIITTANVAYRFGLFASFFVPLLLMAGGWLVYQLVGSLDNLLSTGYGQVLLCKMILVTGLLGLAAVNKLRLAPALKAGDVTQLNPLRASISVEIMLMLAILMATAILTSVLALP